MTIGRTVMDAVPGAVAMVSAVGAITAPRSVCRARQPAEIPVGPGAPQPVSGGRVPDEAGPRLRDCLSGRLPGCSLAGSDEGKSRHPACELVAGFPVGPSAGSRRWSSRMAGGLTFAAGEASARAWG
jgi:hypothetical protein